MDEEESTREIDRWVTSLVDLIPTTIYVRNADLAKTISYKIYFFNFRFLLLLIKTKQKNYQKSKNEGAALIPKHASLLVWLVNETLTLQYSERRRKNSLFSTFKFYSSESSYDYRRCSGNDDRQRAICPQALWIERAICRQNGGNSSQSKTRSSPNT